MLSFELKTKLQNIKEEYPNVGPVAERCTHFLNLLENHTETTLLETVLNEFGNYAYLPIINNMIKECVDNAKINHNKYLVEKTIMIIDQMNDPIAHGAMKQLQTIAEQSETEITDSIRKLDSYDFIPQICELRKAISFHNNGARGTSDVRVSSNTYSPIIRLIENKVLFNLENKFYIFNKTDKTIEENFDRLDGKFIERSNFFKGWTINEDNISFHFKNKEYKIDEDKFYINGAEMSTDPVKLFESIDWNLGMGNTHIAHQIYDIFENRYDIAHLDFITKMQSKYNNSPIVYNLMKLEENLYINKVNTYNGDSSFEQVKDVNECVEMLKQELNYDITENIKDFKDKKEALIIENKNAKNTIVDQLTHLNEEILKFGESEKTNENLAVITYLNEEIKNKNVELEKIQSKLNQSLVESMEDKGYVETEVKANYQGVKKGDCVYAFSQDLTKKGDKDLITCKTKNGEECKIPKGMLKVNLK